MGCNMHIERVEGGFIVEDTGAGLLGGRAVCHTLHQLLERVAKWHTDQSDSETEHREAVARRLAERHPSTAHGAVGGE